MNIVLVIPTFKHGGMERVMSELASYWSGSGHTINIIFLVNHTPFFQIDSSVKSSIKPNFSYNSNIFSKTIYSLRLLIYLRKNVERLNPEVVFSFGEGYNSFVLLALKGLNHKIFISDRSSPLKKLSVFKKVFMKILYPGATGIIAQTSTAKDYMLSRINHKNIWVVPNPIKLIKQIPSRKENVVLNVGRLVEEKNQLTLIKIFSEVHQPGWELHIVGDGPLKKDLEECIDSLQMTEHIKLLGSQKDLSPFFSRAKIFALSSVSEGYPNSLCEAMAFPIASISFDCVAGPRDIIKDGANGFLIETDNNARFCEKLSLLMSSSKIRETLCSVSKNLAKEQSVNHIGDIIIDIFVNHENN